MKCPKCGAVNADDAKFCKMCREPLESTAPKPVPKPVPAPAENPASETKKLLLPVIIGVIVVVAVVVLIVVLMHSCGTEKPSSYESNGTAEPLVETAGETAGETEAETAGEAANGMVGINDVCAAYADQVRELLSDNPDLRFGIYYLDSSDTPYLLVGTADETEIQMAVLSVYTYNSREHRVKFAADFECYFGAIEMVYPGMIAQYGEELENYYGVSETGSELVHTFAYNGNYLVDDAVVSQDEFFEIKNSFLENRDIQELTFDSLCVANDDILSNFVNSPSYFIAPIQGE